MTIMDDGWPGSRDAEAKCRDRLATPQSSEARVGSSSDPNIVHQIAAKLAKADI